MNQGTHMPKHAKHVSRLNWSETKVLESSCTWSFPFPQNNSYTGGQEHFSLRTFMGKIQQKLQISDPFNHWQLHTTDTFVDRPEYFQHVIFLLRMRPGIVNFSGCNYNFDLLVLALWAAARLKFLHASWCTYTESW